MAKSKSDIEEFLKRDMTHVSASNELIALWYDGNGNWKLAHDQVDDLTSKSASRVHAYLHRKEGDIWNADYWYSKAGEKRPEITLDEEWGLLFDRFISENQ